jgi:hypothetical protein
VAALLCAGDHRRLRYCHIIRLLFLSVAVHTTIVLIERHLLAIVRRRIAWPQPNNTIMIWIAWLIAMLLRRRRGGKARGTG